MNIKISFAVICTLISLILLRNSISSFRNLSKNEDAVQDLRKELHEKRKENEFLTQRLSYVKSDEFVEREAREKLGLVQENEYPVFVVPPNNTEKASEMIRKPNWVKWKEVFRL